MRNILKLMVMAMALVITAVCILIIMGILVYWGWQLHPSVGIAVMCVLIVESYLTWKEA